MRLIDADALRIEIEKINSVDYGSISDYYAHSATSDVLRDIMRILDAAPTVEPDRWNIPLIEVIPQKTAHWVDDIRTFSVMNKFGYVTEETKTTHTCSDCNVGIVGLDNMHFCPNCGADMRKE